VTPNKPTADFANADFYDARPEGFHIGSWSPTPQAAVDAGMPQAPSTQVHLSAMVGPARVIWRFKGPNTLDALIDALVKHREDVWGKR
jgi:hypothetical protein